MADLILTPEEEEALTWMELDDATVGKVVKMAMASIQDEKLTIWFISAANLMIAAAIEANADSLVQTMEGHTVAGKDMGDWKITVKRTRKPDPA